MSKRFRHILTTLRRGPTEAGYAFFRARRRRRNLADGDPFYNPNLTLADTSCAMRGPDE